MRVVGREIGGFILLAATLQGCLAGSPASNGTGASSTATSVGTESAAAVFSPQQLSASDLDQNPLAGFYNWAVGGSHFQAPVPASEVYKRYSWADLESSSGVYNFSALDAQLAALPAGGRFSFRIMAMNPCFSNHSNGVDVPSYLTSGKGWFAASPGTGCTNAQVYVPDWNDPVFLAAVRSLLSAMSARYDGDPRVGFVDIGILGGWGEWHWMEVPYCDSNINTQNAGQPTLASRQAIVDAYSAAFPHKRLVMLTDDKPSLLYALKLARTIPIGMRRDSWGATLFNSSSLVTAGTYGGTQSPGGTCSASYSYLAQSDQDLIFSRWKTAPFLAESYGGAKALQAGDAGIIGQVQGCHVASVGNGSWTMDWAAIAPTDQAALTSAGLAAGHRVTLTSVSVQGKAGGSLSIASQWANAGVAVPYENWNVKFYLVNSAGGTVASTISAINLTQILPTNTYGTCLAPSVTATAQSGSQTRTDTMDLSRVSSGSYDLRIQVVDADGYLKPLTLGMKSQLSDGSYVLGSYTLSP